MGMRRDDPLRGLRDLQRHGGAPPPLTEPDRGAPPRGPGRPPRGPRRRRRPLRWIVRGLALLLVLVLLLAGFVYWQVDRALDKRRHPVAVSELKRGEPTNILLLGQDSRANLTPAELKRIATKETGSKLTDTIIVMQLAPGRDKPVLLSIPRDLRVERPGNDQKINAMYSIGGPDLLVKTVEQVTGLPIHHVVEIDLAGFLNVVDTLGGVTLCNDSGKRIDDKNANLHMDPGCHEMDGAGALAFVRSRKFPNGDFERIAHQQQFMKAIVKKAASPGSLINVPRTLKLTTQVAGNVTIDDRLGTFEAIRTAMKLAGGDLDTRVYPSAPAAPACAGCSAFVEPKKAEADQLMEALRRGDKELPPIGEVKKPGA
jgi:LCP family protein required for cell wall assembly